MKVLVIFTCFNRRKKTENCIVTLALGNPNCKLTFVVVDDGSTDGTREMLRELRSEYDIHLIEGTGNLYYSGGMRTGMSYALARLKDDYNYLFICNDDVDFHGNCIESMIRQSAEMQNAAIVGAMQSSSDKQSYGAVKYIKGTKYRTLSVKEWDVEADTFNANGVLIPYDAFKKIRSIDAHYIHSLGDFDYGLTLKRNGYKIYSSKYYVGICENNSATGTWRDISLTRKERIKKKENVKGAPTKQWFYFLKKNFGLRVAIKGCITPYIRILIGR